MTRVLSEGFELAHLDHYLVDGSKTAPVFATSISGMDGTYCWATAGSNARVLFPLSSAVANAYVGMRFRAPSHYVWGNWMLYFYNASKQCMGVLGRDSGGHLFFYRGLGAALLQTATLTISTNTTYFITIHYKPHDTEGIVLVKVDGVTHIDFTGDAADNTGDVAYIGIGKEGGGLTAGPDAYFDNLVVDDADWPTQTKIVALRPNEAGVQGDWSGNTANNFLDDPDCVAWWRFESGAQATDSKGTNTLTADNTPDVEGGAGLFKEGLYSAKMDRAENERFYITDANLAAGFPLKNGDTTKKFSCAFWYRPTTVPGASVYHGLVTKWYYGGSKISLALDLENGQLRVFWGYGTSGQNYESWYVCTISAARWYHFSVAVDGIAKTCTVRVWDEEAQSATTYTHTFTNELRITDASFYVGCEGNGTQHCDGRMDELVVFKDLLTEQEMDNIRQGLYQSAKHSVVAENPPVASDYIYTNTENALELFTLQDLPGSIDAVKAVTVGLRAQAAGNPTPTQVQPAIRTGGGNYFGGSVHADMLMEVGARKFYAVNPSTGVAWTVDEINALQAGAKAVA